MATELRPVHLLSLSPTVASANQETCLPLKAQDDYQRIAKDPRYQHFARIPARIIRCLDYLGVGCDQSAVRDRLLAYYLFIGVVDRALDSGDLNVGRQILDWFDGPFGLADHYPVASTVELVTEVLKRQTSRENFFSISAGLAELYCEAVKEQTATSMAEYIDHRETIGIQTAELSYLLIQELLRGNTSALAQLMKQVGKVGCLVDSVIDLSSDSQLGLLGFHPSLKDRLRLIACAFWEGIRTLVKYPSLAMLFLEAVVDNVRDRFRAADPPALFIVTESGEQ